MGGIFDFISLGAQELKTAAIKSLYFVLKMKNTQTSTTKVAAAAMAKNAND